jgi:hypothetical protein
MDTSVSGEQGSDLQHAGGILASLPIVSDIVKWLASLIKLTEQDRENAGVYLGGPDGD